MLKGMLIGFTLGAVLMAAWPSAVAKEDVAGSTLENLSANDMREPWNQQEFLRVSHMKALRSIPSQTPDTLLKNVIAMATYHANRVAAIERGLMVCRTETAAKWYVGLIEAEQGLATQAGQAAGKIMEERAAKRDGK